jgi:hypothetical protein
MKPRRLAFLGALVLALSCSSAAAGVEDEDIGALMGDLMFHADLMSALDAMCPSRQPSRNWLAGVRQLPAHVRSAPLRELSRRLSADAGQAMVRGSGGCATREFAQAYAQTEREYEALLEQWARLSV